MSFDSSVPSNPPDYEYYGRIIRFNGSITIKEPGTTTSKFFYEPLPNDEMKNVASKCDTRQADYHIRTEFSRRLSPIPGPYVCIRNDLDESTPSLDFSFVSDSVLGAGVEARDPETTIGCNSENDPGGCRPHMGQGIGCEYGRKCDCQEFAAIDIQRLKAEEREKYKKGDMLGLPKRFPYYSVTSNRPECLVNFYLESRHPIYECNVCCNCGPDCKTRVVQKGRKVKLQIFKTLDRGWGKLNKSPFFYSILISCVGLRTLEDLKEGQFIDTYRGEIITTQEADRREKIAEKDKASYQYALDKYAGEEDLTEDNCYVVDGEFMGGPTRFMNHSCHPNCRQYTVSYNKYDYRIYQLAFFAYTAIKAGTELTFDYLDKDDEDEDNTGESTRDVDKDDPLECRCGSLKCRKRLWI